MADAIAELPGVDQDGKPPATRIKDATAAHAIYSKYKEDDRQSAIERAQVQGMLDGDPPYDERELADIGQSGRCNTNFGLGNSMLEESLASYVDLVNSEETLLRCQTTFGEPNERAEWNDTLALEITRMIRGWDSHHKRHMQLADAFVAHGVGVVYWEDDYNWQWRTTKLGPFQLPHGIEAEESEIEAAFMEKTFTPSRLYGFIRGDEIDEGWNEKAVQTALVKNATKESSAANYRWEELQQELKNNDVGYSHTNAVIKVVHCWVEEFNGTISHGIFLRDNPEKEWLYYNRGAFSKMTEAFVVYTFGIGNGFYSGIRGLGYKIFPHAQVDDRMLGAHVDGQALRNALIMQPNSEEDVDKIAAFAILGPVAVIPPDYTVQNPRFSTGEDAMGTVNAFRGFARSKTAGYIASNALPEGGAEKSRFEVAAHLEQGAQLSDSQKGNWYDPESRKFREIVRRLKNKDYHKKLPGGDAVQKLKDRLEQKGVPVQALYDIDLDTVRPVRATGSGSPAARKLALRDAMDHRAVIPESGQKRLDRMWLANALGGYEEADQLIPPVEPVSQSSQVKDALLENIALGQGKWVPVLEGEFHQTHAEVHLNALQEFQDQIDQGVPEAQFAEQMDLIQEHGAEHVKILSQDPNSTTAASLRQAYQQFNEAINNGMAALQKEMADQQQEGGQNGDTEDPAAQEMRLKEEKHLQERRHAREKLEDDLERDNMKAEANANRMVMDANTRNRIKEAEAAADITRKVR